MLGEVGPGAGAEPCGALEGGLAALFDLAELAGFCGFEEEGEIVPQEAGLDHDDEQRQHHPVADG